MTILYRGGASRESAEMRRAAALQGRMDVSSVQEQFASAIPEGLLSGPEAGEWSRDRVYSLCRTFWGFVWQAVHSHASCRAAVRQIQAAMAGSPVRVAGNTSAYCQARGRLPMSLIQGAMEAAAASADGQAPEGAGTLNGRKVRVVDGSSVQIADTPANRKVYPYPSGVKEGCGFPVMGFIALYSLGSGAVQRIATGRHTRHDYTLFRLLWRHLRPGDIVLGDRAFCAFEAFAALASRGVDMVARLHQKRKLDAAALRPLGDGDYVTVWAKPRAIPARSRMTRAQFDALPRTIRVRLVMVDVEQFGFRTRKIRLATTLLDPLAYPAKDIAALYLRRWRLEICFRDIKATMRMEQLRCQTPSMARKELLAFLTAHNLVRLMAAKAARLHGADPSRISFKGTVDTICLSLAFGECAVTAKNVRKLDALLERIAKDIVPLRPGRTEPRAVKKRPKNYQILTAPRHQFKEIHHRSKYKRKSKNALS
jgi:hypothetical protein